MLLLRVVGGLVEWVGVFMCCLGGTLGSVVVLVDASVRGGTLGIGVVFAE